MKNKEKTTSFIDAALSDASRDFANEMRGVPEEKSESGGSQAEDKANEKVNRSREVLLPKEKAPQ